MSGLLSGLLRRSMAMALAGLIAVAMGCASTPRVTDAIGAWRAGKRATALEAARGEVERYRKGNHLAQADVDASLAAVDQVFADETPILLPDPDPPGPTEDPMHPGAGIDRGIRKDLGSDGATRVMRALRSVQRLDLARFAPDLFALIWRREPWGVDGPLLAKESKALRSVAIKVAALRALEALR